MAKGAGKGRKGLKRRKGAVGSGRNEEGKGAGKANDERVPEAKTWLAGLLKATIRPRPRSRLWVWIDKHVRIPESSGGPKPGRMRTAKFSDLPRALRYRAETRDPLHDAVLVRARGQDAVLHLHRAVLIAERFGKSSGSTRHAAARGNS